MTLVGYVVVVWRAREVPARVVIAAVIGLHAAFLVAPPLLSQDVFSYLAYARLGAVHGLDPYATAPAAAAGDPVFPFAGSKASPSVYGPVFTLATYPLAWVPVPVAFWSLKAVAAASSLAAVALVWRAARRGADPRGPALLVGLNPALLAHVVAGAHNEAVVMLMLAGALLVFVLGRAPLGSALASAATAVKASAALVAPFLVVGTRGSGRTLAAAGAAVAAVLVVAIVGIAGFGAEAFGWLDAVWANQVRSSSFSFPHKAGELLAAVLPGGERDFLAWVRAVYAACFAAATAWLLWRTWRGADPIAMAGWATLALLLCSAWLVPWYLAWLLPLAALGRSRGLVLATFALTAWVLAIAVPF